MIGIVYVAQGLNVKNLVELFTDTVIVDFATFIKLGYVERKNIYSILKCYRAMIGYYDDYKEYLLHHASLVRN